MKKLFFISLLLLVSGVMLAQTTYVKIEDRQTKYETLTKQRGVQCHIVDYNLPLFGLQLSDMEITVRTVQIYGAIQYFLRFQPKEKNGLTGAPTMVAYEDLVELNTMLVSMIEEEKADRTARKDYIENIYTTSEGFQIGYSTKNRNTNWFVVFGPYNENRVNITSATKLKEIFQKAFAKFDEVMKKNGY